MVLLWIDYNTENILKIKSFVAPTGQWWVEDPPYGSLLIVFQAAWNKNPFALRKGFAYNR